jgi:hypothetical protein
MAKVKAIVRGPEDYFDGAVLHPPGSIVEVDEQWVSDKDTIDDIVTVRLSQPILDKDGNVVRSVTEVIKRRTMFRPLDGIARAIDASSEPMITQPDRLNVTDFLKNGVAEIVAKIESGEIDDFLDVIAMAESQGRGRKTIADAIAARMSKA